MKFASLLLLVLSFSGSAHSAPRVKKPKPLSTCAAELHPLNLDDEVDGLMLGNTHEVYSKVGRLIRGHEPNSKADQLVAIGVSTVLIFKIEVKNEVKKEITDLKALGLSEKNIHHIPMPWQNIKNIEQECLNVVTAANILLKAAAVKGSTSYFHCTAGQDRTGLLSGVLRMVLDGWSAKDAYYKEMCSHGYGFGDIHRPVNVSGVVEKNLNPIFLRLASNLEGAAPGAKQLGPEVCQDLGNPLDPAQFSCR